MAELGLAQPQLVLYHSHLILFSKLDETTEEERLGFIMPQHEYFHQNFVVADCQNKLLRETSRGLEGGVFYTATLLGRKDVKMKKGKDAIDQFKDFFLLKADAFFCYFFVKKFNLSTDQDNTPILLRKAESRKKALYLHGLVEEALKDLLPYFANAKLSGDQLHDFPLVEGRRQVDDHSVAMTEDDSLAKNSNSHVRSFISLSNASSRSKKMFRCNLCNFESSYEAVCLAHVELCVKDVKASVDSNTGTENSSDVGLNAENDLSDDSYWNYKCTEFFLDSAFAISVVFEKYGDGLGMFILSKVLLPLFHVMKHSNYASSIHRFITRINCEATPREGLKLIHERFSNKRGGKGCNIFKDRRMEYRIGIIKKLISNKGSNIDDESIQQVNRVVDIKEELFVKTRESHGVDVRSGRHKPRTDKEDFEAILKMLEKTEAHRKIGGRSFGNLDMPANLLDSNRINQASFFRWITSKNKEACKILNAKTK